MSDEVNVVWEVVWEMASLEEAREKLLLEKSYKKGNVKNNVKKYGGNAVYNYRCINRVRGCPVKARLVANDDQWQFQESGLHLDDCDKYKRRGLSEEHSSRMKVYLMFI